MIKGLECCAIDGGCDVCPYDSFKDCPGSHPTPETLMKDALALLKAQEPRVMTLEEVLALPYDTPIYIENCDYLCGWDIFAGITKDDDNDVVTGALWSTTEYWPQDKYGDTWRCWTSRPTDEQREAIPWND